MRSRIRVFRHLLLYVLYILYVAGMRPTPYATVVRDPRVGRLLPGFAASYLGDGMSAIAVS